MKTQKSKTFMNIITGIGFCIVLVSGTILFTLILPTATGVATGIAQPISVIVALILAFVISTHYQNLNKVNGDGQKSFRHYFKQIGTVVLLLVLMNIAISEFVGLFFGAFLRGAGLKIPLLVIYLIAVYSMCSQKGYRDANRKEFNLHLRILSMMLVLIIVMPAAIRDSMHNTQIFDQMAGANLQAAFTPNVDVYIFEDASNAWVANPDFNIILTIITLFISFAAQMGLMIFAYKHGKQSFMKKRLNPAEFETDEKC